MNQIASVSTALCLPFADVVALSNGRMIVALAKNFVHGLREFALCPVPPPADLLTLEQTYRQEFLATAQANLKSVSADHVTVHTWAKLESCTIYSDVEDIEAIAQLTIWQSQWLQDIVKQRYRLFLACLRVYQLPNPIEIPANRVNQSSIGKFIRLANSAPAGGTHPVLDDLTFTRRSKQLAQLAPPDHPELEMLQSQVVTAPDWAGTGRWLACAEHASLDADLQAFLGWVNPQSIQPLDSDLAWIQQIKCVGNSSDGDAFEKLVRRSLLKLGFTNSEKISKASLNPETTGGAGGIDVYCEAPFALVGECKASQFDHVPNGVAAQLINLGTTHLGKAQFERSVKVIFAAGRLTQPADDAAKAHKMNVIRPETLQSLMELKAKHPGSIDLMQLEECLRSGVFGIDADGKVRAFIEQTWERLKLRSKITHHVEEYQSVSQLLDCEAGALYDTFNFKNPNIVSRSEFEQILIELSSPLVGWLGRRWEKGWASDRYYYIRNPGVS